MNTKQIVLAVVGVLVFFIFVFILWEIRELLTFRLLFPQFMDELISQTGINIWLARAFSAFLSVSLLIGIMYTLSNGELKRNLGLGIICIVVIVFSVSMYAITKDNLFNPNGTAKECYTRLTNGNIELANCNWKVHNLYGTPIKRLDDNIMTEYQSQNRPLPEVKLLKPNRNTRFFSNDGKPLFWYYQHENNKLEFFDHPGHHPQLNTVLAPISPEIVMQFLHYRQSGNNKMIEVNSDNKDVIQDLLSDIENHW
jgi:hypothetical protein